MTELTIPWWGYAFLFFYSGWGHYTIKGYCYPFIRKPRLLLQSMIVGAIIAGFAILKWRIFS